MPLRVTLRSPNKGKGFVQERDARDDNYSIEQVLSAAPRNLLVVNWEIGPVLDQGTTSTCVGHAAQGLLTATPNRQAGLSPFQIYDWAHDNDEFPPQTEGTSIRAGLQALRHFGKIKAFYWAKTTDQMTQHLLTRGPLIVGTDWLKLMETPDHLGRVLVQGAATGGHAYLLYGVDLTKQVYRAVNSWGESWGNGGRFDIPIAGFAKLLKRGGVAASVDE